MHSRTARQAGRLAALIVSRKTLVARLDNTRRKGVSQWEGKKSCLDARHLGDAALMSGGFGSRMHPVLRDFVDAAGWRLLVESEELIQRAGAFAD